MDPLLLPLPLLLCAVDGEENIPIPTPMPAVLRAELLLLSWLVLLVLVLVLVCATPALANAAVRALWKRENPGRVWSLSRAIEDAVIGALCGPEEDTSRRAAKDREWGSREREPVGPAPNAACEVAGERSREERSLPPCRED